MADIGQQTPELTDQLMLVTMEGISRAASLELAQAIAEEYRGLFPELARTRLVLELFDAPYRYAMSYVATEDGPDWVTNAIIERVREAGGTAEVIHMAAVDITGQI